MSPHHSYRLEKPSSSEATVVGWYGGHPRGVLAHKWPRCRECDSPMCFMAQINAGDWIDLQGWARMSLFICHATGGRCEDWNPWKGSNRVLLHKEADEDMYDGPPTVRIYRRFPLSISAALDEREVMRGGWSADALAKLKHDKLGGGALWLHGDDTPQSVTGSGPMRLLMQITTDLVQFDITSTGLAYVFIDPNDDSEDAACLLWQGG